MGWKSHLPSDWVALRAGWQDAASQKVAAADEFRCDPYPLYLSWADPHSALLAPWKAWMQSYPRLQTPAWINVSTNGGPQYIAAALLAVRDLTLGEPQEAPQIDDKDDYYSASLKRCWSGWRNRISAKYGD